LLDMGVTFDLILPFMETVRENAVLENMDFTRAAYDLTLELRNYRHLDSMTRAIELTKQQLEAINIFASNQQQALTALAHLQQMGISEREIIDIANIVNRWNNQHPGIQGNGGSRNSGGISGGNGSIIRQ